MKKSAESSPSLSVGGDMFARQCGHAWHTTSLVSVDTIMKLLVRSQTTISCLR